jgi:hypothetical protein
MLAQFQGQPNFEGQLRSFLVQVQEIEVMLFSLMAERYLSTAVGAQLDGIGRVVGEPRSGKNDLDYRVALQGRIIRNRANSRIEDIHTLFGLLLPGFSFTLTENPSGTVAHFFYEIDQALTPNDPSPAVLNAQLQDAKGAGIRVNLLYGNSPQDESFTYASGDVAEASAAQGYGNDAGTSGGHYRDLFS